MELSVPLSDRSREKDLKEEFSSKVVETLLIFDLSILYFFISKSSPKISVNLE